MKDVSQPERTSDGSNCTLYLPGHQVHYIQALHSSREPRRPRTGRVTSVTRGIITVEFPGDISRYRSHLTGRLRAAVEQGGPQVLVDEGWSILRVPQPADNTQARFIGGPELVGKRGPEYAFSIARVEDPWRRCRSDPLTQFDADSLEERARTHGGYAMAGNTVTLVGTVVAVDGNAAPDARGRAGEAGSLTLRLGASWTVEIDASTAFTDGQHSVTSFSRIAVGSRIQATGSPSGHTLKATAIVIDPYGSHPHGPAGEARET